MDLFGFDAPEDDDEPAEAAAPVLPETSAITEGPRAETECLGHEAIESRILAQIDSGTLPHGLIFAGPSGVGKAAMAFRIARRLLTQGLDPVAAKAALRRIASGGHGDLLYIERAEDSVKGKKRDILDVDEIRRVAPFLRMTASEGGWRAVIIDDADTMNRNAQNALLKVLEEPPPRTCLILVAHRKGALLPTIRSRAHSVAFGSLDAATIRALLGKAGYSLSADEIAVLEAMAGGSIGRARSILDADGLTVWRKSLDILASWPAIDRAAAHDYANAAGTDSTLFSDALVFTFDVLARAKARAQGVPKGFGVHADLAGNLLAALPLERLVGLRDALHSHFEQARHANLDQRTALLTAFSLLSA